MDPRLEPVGRSPNVLNIIPQNHVSTILFLLTRNIPQCLAKLVLGEMFCCSFHVSVPSLNLNLCPASSVPRPPIYLPQPHPFNQRLLCTAIQLAEGNCVFMLFLCPLRRVHVENAQLISTGFQAPLETLGHQFQSNKRQLVHPKQATSPSKLASSWPR
jgi:hypothetical protein